ncbi:hypothetical protein AB6735_27425 [Mucilaginibacter sp. RCC_168]|jgi:hypothetical protein|uniref:hypothetical protein n=1 Tax=unclassified Mucilaginibacter TaxID=2617802 RepID=UPI00087F2E16|nr:hypothetical protein [Mucilaginibacter sp. OK268]SDP85931.1 hypothetical protein SAMN05428975_3080 [Mucilaginibacter sp. OK268]
MNIFEQLKSTRNQEFANAIHPNTGKLSPRKGFLVIRSLYYQQFGEVQIAMAKIQWKRLNEDLFLDGVFHDIALRSLFHKESKSNHIKTAIEDLVDKYIYIDEIALVLDVAQRNVISVRWGILQKSIEQITKSNAAMYAMFNGSNTLSDVWSNFEKNAPYDVDQAIDDEANGFEDDYSDDDMPE